MNHEGIDTETSDPGTETKSEADPTTNSPEAASRLPGEEQDLVARTYQTGVIIRCECGKVIVLTDKDSVQKGMEAGYVDHACGGCGIRGRATPADSSVRIGPPPQRPNRQQRRAIEAQMKRTESGIILP